MTCYQISHDEEPIALVASLGLARRIVCCQPPGYYRLAKIRMGPPITVTYLQDWRHQNRLTTAHKVHTLANAMLVYKVYKKIYRYHIL
jgi:hypothetical protein